MNIQVVAAAKLTPAHLEAWSRLQEADPTLHSPFLRPEFVQAVAAVRERVEVGIWEEGGEAIGFFPFYRGERDIGKPVSGPLCGCQAMIVRQGAVWDPRELVRGCGLRAWRFDHLLASQEPFRPYHSVAVCCRYIDVSQGFETYLAEKCKVSTKTFPSILSRRRRMDRDVGPVRLEAASDDRSVLQSLMRWKSDQCDRTKVANAFGVDWIVALVENLFSKHCGNAFSGMLHALYAGDRLVATALKLRSYDALHGWFMAYNPEFHKYSPGLILNLEMAAASQAAGIRVINMGKSPADYKMTFMTGTLPVAEGSVDLRPVAGLSWRAWLHARDYVRSSRLRRPAHRVDRILSNVRTRLGLNH